MVSTEPKPYSVHRSSCRCLKNATPFPVNTFALRSRTSKLLELARDAGNGPVKLLKLNTSLRRAGIWLTIASIKSPVSPFSPKFKYCREEQLDSLENSEGTVYLSDGSSCAIRGIGTISWRTHDDTVRRLGEVRYISNFRRNLISLSRLDSRGYRMIADGGILRVLCGDRIVLEGKKRSRGHYYLAGSPVRGEALGARWSPERGGAPGGGSGTRQETREDER